MINKQLFLNFIASKSLKLSSNLNYVLKLVNELKTISHWLILLSRCVRNLKPFLVNKNRSWVPQTHTRDIINILLTSWTLVFCPSIYVRAWAINRGGKNSVRNLRYGPRTRLVRGINNFPVKLKGKNIRKCLLTSCFAVSFLFKVIFRSTPCMLAVLDSAINQHIWYAIEL